MKILGTLAFVVCLCVPAVAQTTSSLITGSVTDPESAAVPGANITIVNPVTGQSFSIVSNAQGEFTVPAVPAGTYRVTVKANGFRSAVLNDVKVDAAVPATVNVKLEVGS